MNDCDSAMLSSSDEEFLLLDSFLPKLRKRIAVHEINRERNVLGEYHHLFPQLKSHADRSRSRSRFYAFTRMSLVTFTTFSVKLNRG